jgi:alpha-ketoglutarate-dependent taurine dioxygenase
VLLEHKVIFFRDQGHLDDAEQERFAVRLGKLVPHPTVGATKGTSSILELDSGRGGGRADQWHTDVTFVDAYPKISVLRGVEIPPYGGDTIWSNTAAAYHDLPEPLRKLADELWAVHSNAYDYAVKTRASEADRKHFEEVFTGTIYETEHPAVRVHPETGERTLVLGNFVQRFVGLPKYDGQKLFDLFQSDIAAPETPCAGAGGPATSRSGTIAPRSTTRSTTMAISIASFAAPPSMATCRSASMAAAA